MGLKQIVSWCIRHKPAIQRRIFRRRTDTLDSTGSAGQISMGFSSRTSTSSATLVDEKNHGRALGSPAMSDVQHVYSYYPWTESEHEEILSRSPPPPMRRHYETFPSLVEMGGFLSL
ncbi:hypothetical protein H4R18_004594 [Coemansia javaensis]|uniref:Uncharacterized protein n=1 Tax=Coemansia javaensis TaxID=2761396 RepID=A0A9W8HB62_9FUNG|nr:hypothetical protein H4R18_004594 [Coemansia javaensis]